MYAEQIEERPTIFVSTCLGSESWCQFLFNLMNWFVMKLPLLCIYEKLTNEIALAYHV